MRQGMCVALLLATAALPNAQVRGPKTLSIYMVDVEGGNATLFVSPTRESLLIDTGHGGGRGCAGRTSHHGCREGCRNHAD
jgi:hypothetical protein